MICHKTKHLLSYQCLCIRLVRNVLPQCFYSKVNGINRLVPTSFNHSVSQHGNKEHQHFSATVIIPRYLMVKKKEEEEAIFCPPLLLGQRGRV